MISGDRRRLLAGLSAAAVLAVAPAAGRATEAGTLERLMAAFAKIESTRARFTERGEVGLLEGDVESSGVLSYVRPDRLEKLTLEPERESLRVEGDRVTLTGPDGTSRSLSISSSPEIEAYVESIRATHRGDLATLKRHYYVRMEGGLEGWHLFLEPRDPRAGRLIRAIVLTGAGAAITQLEVQQPDGDRSIMRIVPDPP